MSIASGDFWGGDPHPTLARLRAEDPVHWDEAGQVWGVTRYADVRAVSTDPAAFSSAGGIRPDSGPTPMMIDMDDPDHLRRRKLVNRGFTPRRVRDQEARITEVVDRLVDGFCEAGTADMVGDFAAWLPLVMIGDALGVASEDHPTLLRWSDDLMRGQGQTDPDLVAGMLGAFEGYTSYIGDVIEDRAGCPRDDLMSVLVHAEVDGDRLSHDEVVHESLLILIGGDETTRHVITGGLYQLLCDPDRWDRLAADRSLVPGAVEESLRWVSPIKNMARTATRDVELAGSRIAAGQKLLLLYPSANRDERPVPRAGHVRPRPHAQRARGLRVRAPLLPRCGAGPARGPGGLRAAARPAAGPPPRRGGRARAAVPPTSSAATRACPWPSPPPPRSEPDPCRPSPAAPPSSPAGAAASASPPPPGSPPTAPTSPSAAAPRTSSPRPPRRSGRRWARAARSVTSSPTSRSRTRSPRPWRSRPSPPAGSTSCSPTPADRCTSARFDTADVGAIRATVDLNLVGTMLCIKHAVPAMKAAGGGSIIGMSSGAGHFPHRWLWAYGAAKAGIDMVCRYAAEELGEAGIRVNSVQPGIVDDELMAPITGGGKLLDDYLAGMPLGRVGTVDDIAAAVRFLAGPESSWITGVNLPIDGGHHLRKGADYSLLFG